MPTTLTAPLQPRKTPLQARSTATVDAIFEATIQVLRSDGSERLTTTRVAQRAGVSVGTLYQYYPNKQALLFALLEEHLNHVGNAVEQACRAQHCQPIPVMVQALVDAFIDAKMQRQDISSALYRIAAELNVEGLSAKYSRRFRIAVTAMLRTAPGMQIRDFDFVVFMLMGSMVGTTRAVLEAGATRSMVVDLRRHLALMAESYLASATG